MRSRSLAQLGEVGHDEPRRGGGRRGAHVGGEIAERRVLLVADRRDDGHVASGDRAHDAFVGERKQVLEAAAAAGEDDHVGTAPTEVADRRADRSGRARALDVGLGDERRSRVGSAGRCA